MLATELESLEQRCHLAVTAVFPGGAGVLRIVGDGHDNTIIISRNAAGNLLVNGGAIPIRAGTPTVANTSLIQVRSLAGDDVVALDESNGALPRANLDGGPGDDALTGGSGADELSGGAGNDVLLGKGGADSLFGGAGNDVLTGGDGNDQVFGEAGNDRMIWNPGDDSDLNEGGAGMDTVEVNGGNGAEVFSVAANGTRVRFDRTSPAPFSIDIGTSENLVLNANGGDDTFTASGNLAGLIRITADGGAGNDTFTGSDGADVLLGGDGNDLIDGQQGSDVALLGAGDDTFQWDPGDGSDVVEGQAGHDTLLFNGSNANENIDLSANGQRVRLVRDVGSVTMDLNDVEQVDINALGGADRITVNDLSGTDLAEVNVNLAGAGGAGDSQPDTVVVGGTPGDDLIEVVGTGTSAAVAGLPTLVNISTLEGANDSLVVNGLAGNDTISASTLAAGIVKLTENGGVGEDSIFGSRGADVLIGEDDADFIDGQQGNDVALLGAGDDVFQWDPGDGSDVVEGQEGRDTLLFNGANIGENIDISANGQRVRFFRDVGNVTMDLNDVEQVDFEALGGADTITVNDLTGTDLVEVNLNLAGAGGAGDGQADTVIVNGTDGADSIGISGDASAVVVSGLSAQVNITAPEAANDALVVNGLGGTDTIDASGLAAGALSLTLNGGADADVLLGSQGGDTASGGTGGDVALLGAGDDTFVWNPGDGSDIVEGQAGFDTLLFNGANIGENIDISANGQRVRFFRNVGNVTMDLNDVEQVDFKALGGADTITVNDLSGTDVVAVNVNLAAAGGGGGDGQSDTVVVRGTNGDDVANVVGDASGVTVLGLAATVHIFSSEPTLDTLKLEMLAGDDVVDASGLSAGAIAFVADGGDANDVLIGSAGDDVLLGGAGDDVLMGGPGTDVLDGGTGDNVLIQ